MIDLKIVVRISLVIVECESTPLYSFLGRFALLTIDLNVFVFMLL